MPHSMIALHALHTIPASLLNRDDSNDTKTITFNGTRRVRVSSQSWKRAMRTWLRKNLADQNVPFALRTVRLPALVIDALVAGGLDEAAALSKVAGLFAALGLKINEKTGNTSASLFVPQSAPNALADLVAANLDSITATGAEPDVVGAAAALITDSHALDVALFGRFLAELKSANVDAAVSVAHAFSVEACPIMPDFFTAVDDAACADDTQVMSMGVTDLSAPTLYRHAVLDLPALSWYGPAFREIGLRGFVRAFVESMPDAKVHSSAPGTLPGFVVAQVSSRPTSLADAFAVAVDSADVYGAATKALGAHATKVGAFLGAKTVVLAITADADELAKAFPDAVVVGDFDAFVGELDG